MARSKEYTIKSSIVSAEQLIYTLYHPFARTLTINTPLP